MGSESKKKDKEYTSLVNELVSSHLLAMFVFTGKLNLDMFTYDGVSSKAVLRDADLIENLPKLMPGYREHVVRAFNLQVRHLFDSLEKEINPRYIGYVVAKYYEDGTLKQLTEKTFKDFEQAVNAEAKRVIDDIEKKKRLAYFTPRNDVACKHIEIPRQLIATCWFNASIAALFFSQHT